MDFSGYNYRKIWFVPPWGSCDFRLATAQPLSISSSDCSIVPESTATFTQSQSLWSKYIYLLSACPLAIHMGCHWCHVSPSTSQRCKKFTRYQLPGFRLPLNFTPNNEFTSDEYDFKTKCNREIVYPQLGEYGALYPNTLDGQRARQVIYILPIKSNFSAKVEVDSAARVYNDAPHESAHRQNRLGC